MKEGWTTRWKALFIWLSGYLSFIAFAVVGGYVIVNMTDNYYASNAYDAYGVIQQITNIAKIVVYAVFALIAFFGGKNTSAQPKTASKAEENAAEKD